MLEEAQMVDGRIKSGVLTDQSGNRYPIVDFIPRFVPNENYCSSFTVEWEQHPEVCFGIFSNLTQYKERFFKETRWGNNLGGQLIVEAGCGSGPFTPHALETGATVVSFDASRGVEQNYKINGQNENVLILQADIYKMPFPDAFFDKVFCLGVLQHTPSPLGAFIQLVSKLKPGGHIVSDIYSVPPPENPYSGLLKTKYFLRKLTAGKNPERLHKRVSKYVQIVWPISRAIRKIPKLGISLNRRLLIDDYPSRLTGMNADFYKDFAVLDIFDMLSPMYDFPQTLEEFERWHSVAGLEEVEVQYGYNGIEGRGRKSHLNNIL